MKVWEEHLSLFVVFGKVSGSLSVCILPGEIKYPSWLIIDLSLWSENSTLKPNDSLWLNVKSKLSTSRMSFNPPVSPFLDPFGCKCQWADVYSEGKIFFVSLLTKLANGEIKQHGP